MAKIDPEMLTDFITTNELLACITPGADDYIQTIVNTKNKADYQKLKKLFDEQRFEAKSFEDSDLDILNFDWQALERDRNWWWQLQALPFLNWYANSFSLQSKEERTRYFSLCLGAFNNWVLQAKQNNASPLVWHDHAAAFRVRNLTNWLVFCHSRGIPLCGDSHAELLGSLILEHLNWLQDDKNYSQHTNHGFDQALIALTIASMINSTDFEVYRQHNRRRLRDEVTFAFTDEGVHKENSPGYQKTMLGRLKQLRALASLGEQDVSRMGERYIQKAEDFLRAITLPNGYLPMIGDTRGGDEGLPYEQKEQMDVLDYSASGYAIIRGKMESGLDFFLLFKNTHESNYHRHDDDLIIFLHVDGETVLGDGGLGIHQEGDQKRQFLRSVFSHSVPFLNGEYVRDRVKLQASPILMIEKNPLRLVGVSKAFGVSVKRLIDCGDIARGRLAIEDSCDGYSISSNWFFNEKPVFADKQSFDVYFSKFVLRLEAPESEAVSLFRGWNSGGVSSSAIKSEVYADFAPAQRIVFDGANTLKTSLTIKVRGEP
jgi:hypothetical protein